MENVAINHLSSRPLGSRGSRRVVSSAEAAAELSPTASAVLSALPAWWSARAERAGLTGRWLDVTYAVEAEPPFSMSSLPQLEDEWGPLSGEDVGRAYVEALSSATRSRHGRHYTPQDLSQYLWQNARLAFGISGEKAQPLPGLVRDPACGAGALLLPALREHLRATTDVNPAFVLARLPELIEGIDNDPAAVWIANLVLAAEMLPLLAEIPESRRRPLPALCRVGDGLNSNEREAVIIIMNPPYGRVKLSPEERERFADVVYGHANLYGLFIAAAEESLSKDGVLAALVPTSFLAGRYFSPLRKKMSDVLRLSSIAFVEKRSGVFNTVLQETCLPIFTRRKIKNTNIVGIRDDSRLSIAQVDTPRGEEPWILPRRTDLAAVSAAAAGMNLNLSTAGWKVSTGPLVWNRRTDDLTSVQVKDSFPVIWAADFDGGRLHLDDRRNSMRYLKLHSEKDHKVMVLTEPAILIQRTSAPEQIKRLTSVHLTQSEIDRLGGAVVVENHVNVVRPSRSQPAISMELLGRLLATNALDAVARCISGSVALSAFELSSLPLPNEETLSRLENLDDAAFIHEVTQIYRVGGKQ